MKMRKIITIIQNHFLLKLFPVWTLRRMGMEIGDNCYIDRHIFIPSEPYLIKVGNNVGITSGVHLHTHGGARVLYDKVPDYDAFGKITIEDLAYIGSGAQIMPGVTIGEGSLVAAGAIVTKSVPKHTVVAGNPARIVCTVDEFCERNLKFNTHSRGMAYAKKKKLLLSLPEDRFMKKKYMQP